MLNFPSILESIGDLDKTQIDGLLKLAEKFKFRTSLTTNFTTTRPVVATLFLENSTRTKHSFFMAIENLGGRHMDFNAEKSSLSKGESLEETLLTLYSQGVNACVIRSSDNALLNPLKQNPPLRVINGGDGTNEHPTQALLDLFTMQQWEGEIEGKTIAIMGDCLHSRVTHSLVKLLPMYGAKVIISGPRSLCENYAKSENLPYVEKAKDCLQQADIIYLLRMQLERHQESFGDLSQYNKDFGLSLKLMKDVNKFVPVYHPGPCNIGVELDLELLRSQYYRGHEQVKHSIPMRMAIILAMLENGDKTVGTFANLSSY
ncbi:aspartate carbamoyltransferase [Bacteriovorax sp. BSW11_IV]|uniref:aspartate carbamoyltransferase catalytic subunit n=1 Tax=Bacteriovorax sp. BSW11_IV TaxID=1353529 RepID=UPI00038A342D|nr:aspartate carbamoyltransferase catalytic subunit [Bacteriovorax sp. BSW11_IV]EQC48419.1 aspartate carbamoyltransferase [Bacteriovorax sp. BSW11_IV]